ncbi:MAG: isoprenylcysteine carboxyl methyltransferase family protein [Candidatus Binataceae bacterium]
MVIDEHAWFAILAVIAAERLVELIISRRNAARAMAAGGFEVGRRHYAAMVALHSAFLISCLAESLLIVRRVWPALSLGALAAVIAAEALRYWAVWSLGERWNTRINVRPDTLPITRGPYKWTRHPNYLAVIIEIAALPLIRGCWITAAVFTAANAVMMAVRIPAEERALGIAYARQFDSTPRFIPRFHAKAGSRQLKNRRQPV